MLIRESPNLVNQLTTPKCLYQTITQTLAQSLCGYRCVICTCDTPMCCHRVCVQGLHSTGHVQHPTQELAIRVATLTTTTTSTSALLHYLQLPCLACCTKGPFSASFRLISLHSTAQGSIGLISSIETTYTKPFVCFSNICF